MNNELNDWLDFFQMILCDYAKKDRDNETG